jgi:hypothetical protein
MDGCECMSASDPTQHHASINLQSALSPDKKMEADQLKPQAQIV